MGGKRVGAAMKKKKENNQKKRKQKKNAKNPKKEKQQRKRRSLRSPEAPIEGTFSKIRDPIRRSEGVWKGISRRGLWTLKQKSLSKSKSLGH